MASIYERNGKFCVVYNYTNTNGERKQKWETYDTRAEARRRKKEIEYKLNAGALVIPQCKYMKDLLREYVDLYGKDKWALSTYRGNVAIIDHYILPLIGDVKLENVNTRFLEQYYRQLQNTKAVVNPMVGKSRNELVGSSTIRDIHKLLRSCFEQAVKWELMEKNPAVHATVPKYKSRKREIWSAETLRKAFDSCEDEILLLSMNLAFAGSLRIGELLALTWDCVDISREAIEDGKSSIYINKELQRVSKEAIRELDGKDIMMVFPEEGKLNKTVRVLKAPKTESSVPVSSTTIEKKFRRLIDEQGLPEVVFHSLRHSSVTYKLKLNGGDIKSVQGDSGHAQVSMVTDVYSHIMDDDRKKNAALLEEAFYARKDLNPEMRNTAGNAMEGKVVKVPEGVDAEMLAKVMANPEMAALLASLAKAMEK